jgi:hypothetical protein
MAASGQVERLPPLGLSACFLIRQETVVGTHGKSKRAESNHWQGSSIQPVAARPRRKRQLITAIWFWRRLFGGGLRYERGGL